MLVTWNQKLIISSETSSTGEVFQLVNVYEQKVEHSHYCFTFTFPPLDIFIPKKKGKKKSKLTKPSNDDSKRIWCMFKFVTEEKD